MIQQQQTSSSHVTKGSMSGQLRPLEQGQQQEEEKVKPTTGGLLSFFKGLTGGKTITSDAMKPILDKMTDHLIGLYCYVHYSIILLTNHSKECGVRYC